MNPIPAFNGPGISVNQHHGSTNIQGVPIYSTQFLQQNQVIPQANICVSSMYTNQPLHPTNVNVVQTKNQHLHRMSSTSDEEFNGFDNDDQNTQNIPWQTVTRTRSIKRRKINASSSQETTVNNKYSPLSETNEENNAEKGESCTTTKPHNPPPIYIYGVTNYEEMTKDLKTIVEEKQYITKCLANNTIKINCDTPDTFRKIIKYIREKNVVHHTYQPKDERAYRIVIKQLHYSTDIEEIKLELDKHGHKVRNIMNGRSRTSKDPLNLFFVDLEPADNNKEIYKLTNLNNRAIKIEPPNKDKNISQCTRC